MRFGAQPTLPLSAIMSDREIIVCPDLADLNQKAAKNFILLAKEAIEASGQFIVALSGGSTPRQLYALLAAAEYGARIPWPRVYLFWGDERCVPPDHPDSNYRMASENLLSKIPIPKENVHRMEGEEEPQVAASKYEETIRDFFQLSDFALPRFDLIFLGLGDDGHTASLFPGSEALRETKRLVLAPYVEKLKAHRLTLTLPVFNHAAHIFFLVTGKSKAAVLGDVLQRRPGSRSLPAQHINPLDGRLVWFVEQAAAGSLQTHAFLV